MNKFYKIICKLACFLCLFAFVGGCSDQSAAPEKPKVVRKKIVAQAKTAARPRKTAPAPKVKAKPVFRPKSDIARGKGARRAPAGQKIPPAAVATKTTDLKPKSFIAKTPAAKKPKQLPKQLIAQKHPAQAKKPQSAKPTGPPKAISATRPAADLQKSTRPVPGAAAKPVTVAGAKPAAAKKKPAAAKKGPPKPYNPEGKIDPFKPLFKEKPKVQTVKKKKRIPRTPLEKVALSQLKLVGIIVAPSGNRALVQEASGKGYIIKKGTYIGLNSGKVETINKDKVIIEEEVEDIVGKITTRKKELVLPKPPGER